MKEGGTKDMKRNYFWRFAIIGLFAGAMLLFFGVSDILVLRKEPDNIEVLDFKASNLFQLSRYKEVIEICKRMLDIDPKNKEALEQWNSACLMSDDNTLPKPPESILKKILKAVITFGIFAGIIYFILSL